MNTLLRLITNENFTTMTVAFFALIGTLSANIGVLMKLRKSLNVIKEDVNDTSAKATDTTDAHFTRLEQKLEEQNAEAKESRRLTNKKLGQLESELNKNRIDTKKIELQEAINQGRSREVVGKIYDSYTEIGGNSYMHTAAEDYLNNGPTELPPNER